MSRENIILSSLVSVALMKKHGSNLYGSEIESVDQHGKRCSVVISGGARVFAARANVCVAAPLPTQWRI